MHGIVVSTIFATYLITIEFNNNLKLYKMILVKKYTVFFRNEFEVVSREIVTKLNKKTLAHFLKGGDEITNISSYFKFDSIESRGKVTNSDKVMLELFGEELEYQENGLIINAPIFTSDVAEGIAEQLIAENLMQVAGDDYLANEVIYIGGDYTDMF